MSMAWFQIYLLSRILLKQKLKTNYSKRVGLSYLQKERARARNMYNPVLRKRKVLPFFYFKRLALLLESRLPKNISSFFFFF